MSSDTTVSSGAVTQCGWPSCPSSFTVAPISRGWTRINLIGTDTTIPLILCPFHAVDHVPRMAAQLTRVMVECSCRTVNPILHDTTSGAFQEWRQHAQEVNDPETLVTCQECRRRMEPSPTGMVRRHNAWDRTRNRLLSTLCPGAGVPPQEQR